MGIGGLEGKRQEQGWGDNRWSRHVLENGVSIYTTRKEDV